MPGLLRSGFHDVLIAIHLEAHAESRLNTNGEFIIPLVDSLKGKDVFTEDAVANFPAILGEVTSIRPVMDTLEVQDKSVPDHQCELFTYYSLKLKFKF